MATMDYEAGVIFTAARCGRLDIIKTLVTRGVDVNVKDRAGRTAAHEAARNGHVPVLRLLKDLGADLSAKSTRGVSVAHQAAFGGHISFLKALAEYAVDFTSTDDAGRSPLDVARESSKPAAVQCITEVLSRRSCAFPENFSWEIEREENFAFEALGFPPNDPNSTAPAENHCTRSAAAQVAAAAAIAPNPKLADLASITAADSESKGGASRKIGIYAPEQRRQRLLKFHAKRKSRVWRKRIKYDCRKKLAESRPRIKGRFVSGGGVTPTGDMLLVKEEEGEEDDMIDEEEEEEDSIPMMHLGAPIKLER